MTTHRMTQAEVAREWVIAQYDSQVVYPWMHCRPHNTVCSQEPSRLAQATNGTEVDEDNHA